MIRYCEERRREEISYSKIVIASDQRERGNLVGYVIASDRRECGNLVGRIRLIPLSLRRE